MKKTAVIFLILCFFTLGILAGKPSRDIANRELRDKLDDFEKEIVIPSNDYTPIYESEINPNLANSLAKGGENIITGIFKYAFGWIKGILE